VVAIHHGPRHATGGQQGAESADADCETGGEPVGADLFRQLRLRYSAMLVVVNELAVVASGFTGEDRSPDHRGNARSRHPAPLRDRAAGDGRRLHVRDRCDQRAGRPDGASAIVAPRVVAVDAGQRVEIEVRYRRLDAGEVQPVEAQRVAAVGLDHLRRRSDETAGGDLAGGTGADGERIRQTGVRYVVRGDAVALAAGVEQPERARGDRPDGLGQIGEGHAVAEHLHVFVAARCGAGERDLEQSEGVVEIAGQVAEPGDDLRTRCVFHADDDAHAGDRHQCVVQRPGFAGVVEAGLRARDGHREVGQLAELAQVPAQHADVLRRGGGDGAGLGGEGEGGEEKKGEEHG